MNPNHAAKSVYHAWNTVALEDRLNLVAEVQAQGIITGLLALLIISTIGYSADNFSYFYFGIGACLLLTPLSISYHWRRSRPALIFSYLAVRAVAKRYASGHGISNVDALLVYRGYMKEFYKDSTDHRIKQSLNLSDNDRPVWICLLKGGVVVLSEHRGGAKLEFICSRSEDINCRKPNRDEDPAESGCIIEIANPHNPKKIQLTSTLVGAQYVFEKYCENMIASKTKTSGKISNNPTKRLGK